MEGMEDEQAAALAELFSPEKLANILDEMEVDEAADVLKGFDSRQAAEALREMEEPALGHPSLTVSRRYRWRINDSCRDHAAPPLDGR